MVTVTRSWLEVEVFYLKKMKRKDYLRMGGGNFEVTRYQ